MMMYRRARAKSQISTSTQPFFPVNRFHGLKFFWLYQYIAHVTENKYGNDEQYDHGSEFFEVIDCFKKKGKTGNACRHKLL